VTRYDSAGAFGSLSYMQTTRLVMSVYLVRTVPWTDHLMGPPWERLRILVTVPGALYPVHLIMSWTYGAVVSPHTVPGLSYRETLSGS